MTPTTNPMRKVFRVIVKGRKVDHLFCRRMIVSAKGDASKVQFCLLFRRRKRCRAGRLERLLAKIRPSHDLASHNRVNATLHDSVAQSTVLIGQGEHR